MNRSSSETLARLRTMARIEEVSLGDTIAKPDRTTTHIVFPMTCVISIIRPMENGEQFEVGIIGADGAAGLNAILRVPSAGFEAIAQSEGLLARFEVSSFLFEAVRDPALQDVLLKYVYAFMSQIAQHSACNRFHHVGRRLARWLLILHDRLPGDDLRLTHEFLSLMLGTRRSGVTVAINELRATGAISHRRGHVTVENRRRLEDISCECYATVVAEYERALGFAPRVSKAMPIMAHMSTGVRSSV